jgi:hypothetical protein
MKYPKLAHYTTMGSLKNKLPILKVEPPAPARRENAGISGICQKFHNEAGLDESASKM